MKRTMLVACLAIASAAFAAKTISPDKKIAQVSTAVIAPAPTPAPNAASIELYNSLQLEGAGMKSGVFDLALKGLNKLADAGKINTTDKITIIDFSQPSTSKRLYVIDLDNKKILFQSVVSHGRGTGTLWAKSFSNQASSYKSSPGFYVTRDTYTGHNGYSLRLDGLEKNINDNARDRAIVMHGAPYASESSIDALGFLGRSEGCPAVPFSVHKQIINTIKDGSCLFIYTPDESYLNHSDILS